MVKKYELILPKLEKRLVENKVHHMLYFCQQSKSMEGVNEGTMFGPIEGLIYSSSLGIYGKILEENNDRSFNEEYWGRYNFSHWIWKINNKLDLTNQKVWFFLREVQLIKLNLEYKTINLIWSIKLIKNVEVPNITQTYKTINLTWLIIFQERVNVPELWPNEEYWERYNFSNKRNKLYFSR